MEMFPIRSDFVGIITDLMATKDVLYWLIGGGLFYTVGCIFYFFDKYKYMHPLWHLFVLGGSVCHFISVYLLVR